MTETSPVAALAVPPKASARARRSGLARHDRALDAPASSCASSTTTAASLPWDGEAVGEIEVRGPWVTGALLQATRRRTKFHDGWLRTGDVGSVDARRLHPDHRPRQGRHQVGRRVDLARSSSRTRSWRHPAVVEAAVIGVPDERWDERPLALRRARPGATLTPPSCARSSTAGSRKWWLPERWTFIDEVPKTSVGKFDKKVLRSRFAAGALTVEKVG